MATVVKMTTCAQKLILEHRTGALCGKCETNRTESLFSLSCLLTDICSTAWSLFLYVMCVLAYGIGLVALNYMEDAFRQIF